MLYKVTKIIPKPARNFLSKLGVGKLLGLFYDKYSAEFSYQKGWAKVFEANKDKVLEYWKRYRYIDEINKICKINDNSEILDVGCGISTVLHYLKGKKRIGVDPLAHKYLQVYNYPERIEVLTAHGEQLPFNNESFDVVISSNALDHTTSPKKNVDEIYRVLKNKGFFVLTVEIFDRKKRRDVAHPHCLIKQDVVNLMKDKFVSIFERESPWIGMSNYINGTAFGSNIELISVSKKK